MFSLKQYLRPILIMAMLILSTKSVSADKKDEILVAVAQYAIEGNHSPESFLEKVSKQILEASKKNANIVVLPEWITLDLWPLKEDKSDREVVEYVADKITPRYWQRLKELSAKHALVIVGGSTAFRRADKIFNTAVAVFPNGRLILQSKNYLTAWEKKTGIAKGEGGLKRINFDWGVGVIAICYDVEFPDLSVQLAKEEVDVFFVPSMTESPQGEKRVEWTSKARAVEHTSYVLISPTVGDTSKDWKHYGRALFLTPQLPGFKGILKEGKARRPSLVLQRLDLRKLREAKTTATWRPAKDMR